MSQSATVSGVDKHTKKRKKSDDAMDGDSVLAGNRFALLANGKEPADGHLATSVRLKLAEETNDAAGHKATPAEAIKTSVDQAAAPARLKLPPLVVVNHSFGDLRKTIYESDVRPVFKITRFGTKVTCSSEADYEKVKSLLATTNAEFYTHDRADSRPFKVVLTGLPDCYPDSLKEQLKFEIGLEPVAVYKMSRRAEGPSHKATQFLIHFPKGSTTLKQLQQVRTVDRIVVHWEMYRQRKNDVTHCQNCLHFGHGARNCHMYSRCNRCGDAHHTDECEQEATVKLRCANCQGQHQATDRSCPKRAEFLQIRKKASTTNQPGRKPTKLPEYSPNSFPPLGTNQRSNGQDASFHRQPSPPCRIQDVCERGQRSSTPGRA